MRSIFRCATPRSETHPGMTESPASALPHWPDVPDCFGWLSLDRRGHWRLRDEKITHPGLIAYLNANYAHDGHGNWLVNNGPQRVFVELECTPLVLRLLPGGSLRAHTGASVPVTGYVCITDAGDCLLQTSAGPGLLDDRDLAAFVDGLVTATGVAANEAQIAAAISGEATEPLFWQRLPVALIRGDAAEHLFGFRRSPDPELTPARR